MGEFTFWTIFSNLLLAARWTVLLSLMAFVSGGAVGLALLFARVSGKPWLVWPVKVYIEFFQGTPLLMQLFICFFGASLIGLEVSPWVAAWILWWRFTERTVGGFFGFTAAAIAAQVVALVVWSWLHEAMRDEHA